MGSTQVGFKVCGSELRRSKDHKGKKVQNLRKSQLLNLRQFQRSGHCQVRPADPFFLGLRGPTFQFVDPWTFLGSLKYHETLLSLIGILRLVIC